MVNRLEVAVKIGGRVTSKESVTGIYMSEGGNLAEGIHRCEQTLKKRIGRI